MKNYQILQKGFGFLNRLINNEKKDEIIKLLDQNNESYKIINYEIRELLKNWIEDFEHSRNIFNREVFSS